MQVVDKKQGITIGGLMDVLAITSVLISGQGRIMAFFSLFLMFMHTTSYYIKILVILYRCVI